MNGQSWTRPRIKTVALALAVVVWLGARPAQAAMIEQTFAFELVGFDTAMPTFALFDPTVGTLTNVVLGLQSTISTELSVTVLSGPVVATLTGGATASVDDLGESQPFALVVTCFVGTCSDSGSEPFDFSESSSDPLVLAAFTGAGSISGLLFLAEQAAVGVGSVSSITGHATWAGTLALAYVYEPAGEGGTPVPQPASMLLLGTGLAAAGGAMRWHRRR